jgi:hypothetical protein
VENTKITRYELSGNETRDHETADIHIHTFRLVTVANVRLRLRTRSFYHAFCLEF